MLPPRRSIPARITASAVCIPASPQPRILAASPARRPSSAAFSCARAAASPPFPLPAREGRHPRHRPGLPAGGADRLVHLRDLPDQAPEPLVLRDLPPRSLQLRPRSQVNRPRPPVRFPRQVPLRPVTGMPRSRARTVRLAALPADLVQRPPPEVPDLPQLRVKPSTPTLKFRQFIRPVRQQHPQSESITTLRLGPQPAPIQKPLRI